MNCEVKLLNRLWICGILNAVLLGGILFVHILHTPILKFFHAEVFWVAVGSIGTLTSVIITCVVFIKSQAEQKKRNTYEIFGKFKDSVFDIELKIDEKYVEKALDEYRESKNNTAIVENNNWDIIKKYLTQVERVSACANSSVLDIDTIYQMSGPYMIKMYAILRPIIEEKRISEGRNTIYWEFEKMVHSLEKHSGKHS